MNKRSSAPRRPILSGEAVFVAIILTPFLALLVVLPFTVGRQEEKQALIEQQRTTTLNTFQDPNVIEAVLSSVTDENGKVLIAEERIRIDVSKIRDIEFRGTTLLVEVYRDRDARLPNLTLTQWREALSVFDQE